MSHPDIEIACSTLGARIAAIELPEPRAGISYLILLQQPESIAPDLYAALASRADTRVVPLSSIGLSNSRNAALTEAKAPYLLFSDDDVQLDLEGIADLAYQFVQDPDLALVAGWRAERLPKHAPARKYLTRFSSGRICAPEFMVDLAKIRAAGLGFDPEFGLGARYGLSEDYVFVSDILRAGLKGIALPVVTGSHPEDSSGDNWSDPELMQARGAVIARVFGVWAPLIRLAYVVKHRRRMQGVGQMLAFVANRGANRGAQVQEEGPGKGT